MLTGNPGHLKGFDYLGSHCYFLTFCTFNRLELLTNVDRVDLVLRQFLRAAREQGGQFLVYTFMPDHAHLLIEMQSDESDGLAFISRAKQYSGYYYKQKYGERLWQRYGYERVLRNDEDSMTVARYILNNPVRKGLVDRAEDYPFSGSEKYTVQQILDAVQMIGGSG